MALTEHDSLIFVDIAMHRGSDRTACEVTILDHVNINDHDFSFIAKKMHAENKFP